MIPDRGREQGIKIGTIDKPQGTQRLKAGQADNAQQCDQMSGRDAHMSTMTIASNRSPWELLTLSFNSLSISCRTWDNVSIPYRCRNRYSHLHEH